MLSQNIVKKIVCSLVLLFVVLFGVNKLSGAQLASTYLPMSVQSIQQLDDFFHIEAEYPQFEVVSPDFNQKIKRFVLDKINDFQNEAHDFWQTRFEASSTDEEQVPLNPETPFVFIASWQPAQLNTKYLSFMVHVYYFSGGAHGNEEVDAFNYDVAAAKELCLNDFLDFSQEALEKIAKLSAQDIAHQLAYMNGKENEFVQEMIKQGTVPVCSNFQNFNFDRNTLTIYFPKYQVAPGAAGVVTVTIPKTLLEDDFIAIKYWENR